MNAPLKAVHFEDPIAPHVRAMLEELGEDIGRAGLAQTPARYAEAMRYLAGGYGVDVESVVGNGVFEAEGEGVVVVRDIEFHSLCEHHLLPFHGTVHVGYLPAGHHHARNPRRARRDSLDPERKLEAKRWGRAGKTRPASCAAHRCAVVHTGVQACGKNSRLEPRHRSTTSCRRSRRASQE